MTSNQQAHVAGTLQKVFMLCLKYPTPENLAIAKEVMDAINIASIQTKEQAGVWQRHTNPTAIYAQTATAGK